MTYKHVMVFKLLQVTWFRLMPSQIFRSKMLKFHKKSKIVQEMESASSSSMTRFSSKLARLWWLLNNMAVNTVISIDSREQKRDITSGSKQKCS